ncbi:MAG: Hpt domain-containing protein, partial [Acidovorax sp.]
MADSYQEPSGAGAEFDLSQFFQIFFEEAGENLDLMEQMLLELDLSSANDEELNGIFRCAHSIKGGAATFGFADVAELTHHMESLLDRLRRHELQPVPEMVDVLLESADASRSLLARHQSGGQGETVSTAALVRRISDLAAGVVHAATPVPAPSPIVDEPAAKAGEPVGRARQLEIEVGPLERSEQASAIKELFRDIAGLGTVKDLSAASSEYRLFAVETTSTNEDLLDLFAFHVSKDRVRIRDVMSSATPSAKKESTEKVGGIFGGDATFGFFDGAPGLP